LRPCGTAASALAAGDPRAKARFLPGASFRQVLNIFLFCALWLFDGVPAARLGLGAPTSWWLTGGLAIAAFGFFAVTAVLQRAKAGEIRTIVEERASALIPEDFAIPEILETQRALLSRYIERFNARDFDTKVYGGVRTRSLRREEVRYPLSRRLASSTY
jgi:hypothetical protein